MTVTYQLVQWNKHKKVYDTVLLSGVVGYVGLFVAISALAPEPPDPMVMLIRAFGTLAIGLLHLILAIGPLARLTDRAAPLLYNRRHLGVTMFLVALAHASLVVVWYGSWGAVGPVQAMFGYDGPVSFELFGFLALLVLFVMASTSHDFWLANLGHRVWKALHMLVYVAYGSVVLHVAFGILRSERDPMFGVALALGAAVLGALHLLTGLRETRRDRSGLAPDSGWVDVCGVDEIQENRARVVCVAGQERVAIVRHAAGLSAVTNVCAHQGGPLGEGRVVDGCLTCPWHGYQYLPDKGQSPPPFQERICTYEVRVDGARVLLNTRANAPGTPVPPAPVEERGGEHGG